MAKIFTTRGAQPIMTAEFVFGPGDTMRDINGVEKTFGAVFADGGTFDAINLPNGAIVLGGSLIVETAGAGPTAYTVKLGVTGDDACFLAASDLLAAANTRYPLLLTKQLAANDGKDLRLTMASTVAAATAGKFRIRVMYTIDGRADNLA